MGKGWLRDFEEFSHWPLQYLENDRKFKGIGEVATSSERMVKISCLVFAKQMTLEATVFPGNTPLLVSKLSMAKLGIVLDIARDRIHVEALDGPDGKWRDVPVVWSVHRLIPIDHLFLEGDGKVNLIQYILEQLLMRGVTPSIGGRLQSWLGQVPPKMDTF